MSRGDSAAHLSNSITISILSHSRPQKPHGKCCGEQEVGQNIGRALGLILFCPLQQRGKRAEISPVTGEVTLHGAGILFTCSMAGILVPFANFAYCLLSF